MYTHIWTNIATDQVYFFLTILAGFGIAGLVILFDKE